MQFVSPSFLITTGVPILQLGTPRLPWTIFFCYHPGWVERSMGHRYSVFAKMSALCGMHPHRWMDDCLLNLRYFSLDEEIFLEINGDGILLGFAVHGYKRVHRGQTVLSGT